MTAVKNQEELEQKIKNYKLRDCIYSIGYAWEKTKESVLINS